MDYRLVKQFSNNAVDNFFNFFYKIVDFGMELVDVFWAFMDIWYHFFMIFINIWLYVYYFLLFALDKLTMSNLFTKKRSSRGFQPGTKAYAPDLHVGHNPMFGKVEVPSIPKIIPVPKSSGKIKTAAVAVAAAATRPVQASGMKRNYFREAGDVIILSFSRFARAFKKIFAGFSLFLSSKLKPVKEEPVAGKSLIDEYMKEYERKKK